MATPGFIFPMSQLACKIAKLASDISVLSGDTQNVHVSDALPEEVMSGISRLLTLTAKLESDSTARTEVGPDEVTQIGEYGFNLISKLLNWAKAQQAHQIEMQAHTIALSLTHWIIQLKGSIQRLDLVADSIACHTNRTSDTVELEKITYFTQTIVKHCDTVAKNDLEPYNQAHSWRTLLLNYAITATRTHDTHLMQISFDLLVFRLPQEAASFFTRGMQKMEKSTYPANVRNVMQQYFDRYSRPKMN